MTLYPTEPAPIVPALSAVGARPRRGCPALLAAGLAAAMGTVLIAFPVFAQDTAAQDSATRVMQQRIDRLESDLAILQRQVYNGGTGLGGTAPAPARAASPAPTSAAAPPPTIAAGLDERISRLEDQVQALTGRVEEIGHNIDVAKSDLDKLSKDVDFRLTALEKGGAPSTGGAPAAGTAPPPGAGAAGSGSEAPPPATKAVLGPGQVLPLGTPQQQYDYSRALLVQQDYAGAEKAFSAFLNVHPDDKLAGSAQYWLGETYYVRANYDQAAKTFAEGYQRFPKSDKAPDTLLKLGMSLGQLNRKKDACGVFDALNQRYPNAPANVKQAAQRERQRVGCG